MFNGIMKENSVQYENVLTVEVERKKALFSAWYEFFPRSASQEPGKHGTFKDCEKLVPLIAEMGFDVIYFPPIHPIGKTNRKGRNNALTAKPEDPGVPWAIGGAEGGHKSIHPELGTTKDFERLIKTAKSYGIEIALDYALQCSPDHPYVKDHPDWFKWRPDGSVQHAENPPKKYQDVLPFNFETDDWVNLWEELKSIVEYWIQRGVTIFRVDNPHTKPFNFWEWMIREIRRDYPDTIFLAEAFTKPKVMQRLGKIGFSQSYTYFTWRTSKYEITTYMEELTKTEMREYFRPNFWPNTPDILTDLLQKGGEQSFLRSLIMAATLSSNYGVYGPAFDFGLSEPIAEGKEEYLNSEKYEVKHWDWFKKTRIREVMTKINQIRKENEALQSTWNLEFCDTDNHELMCFVKTSENSDNKILVVVNLSSSQTIVGYVKVPLWKLNMKYDIPYQVHDLFTGNKWHWRNEWNFVELNPFVSPFHVFRIEEITTV
jgi:starch synthase (maltosyl-transferring)